MPLTNEERGWIQMLSARVDDIQNKLQDVQRDLKELEGRVMYQEASARVGQQLPPQSMGPPQDFRRYGEPEKTKEDK